LEIIFRPHIKQDKAWRYLQDKTTIQILYGGSACSGKSYLGCMWLFLSCLQYPGTRWLMGRSRLGILKRTTLNTFIDIIKKYNFDKCHINNSTSIIYFDNGSQIVLADLYHYPADPNYDRLGSLELTGAFVDELSEISQIGIEVLTSRIRYKLTEYNLTPKLFCASNPYQGWSKNYFFTPYVENRELEHIKFIPALPTDNPDAPKIYLESLNKVLDHALKQRLLYGDWNFDDDAYNLFQYDKLQQTFYNDIFVNIDDKLYLSVDVGDLGKDKTVIGIWKGWSCVKLIKIEKNETTQVVQKVRDLMAEYKILISHIIIDATGVGAGVASLLKGCVRYMAGGKSLNTGYRNLKTELMYKFAERINNLDCNFLFPYDDELIQEALLYKKTFTDTTAGITNKDEIKKKLSRSPDTIDCLYLRAFFDIKIGGATKIIVM